MAEVATFGKDVFPSIVMILIDDSYGGPVELGNIGLLKNFASYLVEAPVTEEGVDACVGTLLGKLVRVFKTSLLRIRVGLEVAADALKLHGLGHLPILAIKCCCNVHLIGLYL